ncbi:hypothetical protein EDB81DRAFT_666993 [Dactylonectria macrodidyma]|uniref:chitinase n=1 Tax=Dactylonectria macrodidyma TaxID=307937 RepID=A0A9P9IIK2_9HYPO|nr:hypothetical protein EDB81DRAFT_666993 [Dactylonectria macrodidyma]
MASSPGHRQVSLSVLLTLLYLSFAPISSVLAYAHGHLGHNHFHQVHDYARRAETSTLSASLAAVTASASGQSSDYTCGPDKPCSNGACCGEDGWCGYSPTYCGDGCQSNCNSKAECGQYAATPGETCPLNVCCSQHGFCGTTADFCNDGCQSNCDSPSPGGSPSNPQNVIIGYWETWNMDKPCGTMGPGEIPVELLTHLFVSFGYVNSAFEITNMDGIDPNLYKTVGNTKFRNPNLKIVIALGGWTFSDPGIWQNIFPSLASTKVNRATFISNLLGFLSQYGYDGVDWEYPGAEDRGGTEVDGENYVALVKELREAIEASGHDYIVTFTAPSSYWYLRHFDLKGMETYVDWINLMSYDLHGVWDSDNPIGSQVLSHTNLTEIGYALDLFWRVGVKPSSIVLGLGFYGRSFELESSSCWKPGCTFKGPGSPGRCSNTAGILSYAEIMEILEKTGGTPYFDEAAAARYMVYEGHSWISFDDVETFQMKIDYASKIGLHGLMIWAIDLDTPNLEALRAISNGELTGATTVPFSLVDLDRIFPADMLPSDDAEKNYALINFGSDADAGEIDPNETGFGFVLVTGNSAAVSSLKKRDDEPEPLVFLDCPRDVLDRPQNETRTARVVCLSEDVEGCFRIMELGIEGTVIEMPDNSQTHYYIVNTTSQCAPNTLARAISLEESRDQSLPTVHSRRTATSKVFDFAFDMNLNHTRRDTGGIQIRIDYSNVGGYWNAAVDSEGIQSGDSLSRRIAKRFFADRGADWRNMYNHAVTQKNTGERFVDQEVDAPLFWETTQNCDFDGEDYELGFGAHVGGKFSADFTYGFSLIASMDDALDVKQANGWLKVDGESDLTFSIAGVGEVDFDKGNQGNPAYIDKKINKLKGHTLSPYGSSAMTFQPYWKLDYMLASFNDSDESGSGSESGPYFDGKISTRVKSDFGGFHLSFPPNPEDKLGTRNVERDSNRIAIDNDNVIYNSGGIGGRLAMGSYFTFGLKVGLRLFSDLRTIDVDLTDMSMNYRTLTEWKFSQSPDFSPETCLDTSVSTRGQQAYVMDDDETIGWNSSNPLPYVVSDIQQHGDDSSCYPVQPSMGKDNAWGYSSDVNVDASTYLDEDAANSIEASKEAFSCSSCLVCGEKSQKNDICCGCANLDLDFGYRDMTKCETCHTDVDTGGPWPGILSDSSLSARGEHKGVEELSWLEGRAYNPNNPQATLSPKKIYVCPRQDNDRDRLFKSYGPYRYPAFPEDPARVWENIENNRWDSISRYWGNTSMSCSDWSVGQLQPHDTAWVAVPNGNPRQVRGHYQTEHVFEGQLIGDFFSEWLDKGEIVKQNPKPENPKPKISCSITEEWILSIQQPVHRWKLNGNNKPFIQLLMAELGNINHLDRLTIFKARPNAVKGRMMGGKAVTDFDVYRTMTQEQQLLVTKEMGMVFNYLNDPTVWAKFCDTYEALYDLFGEFDDYYVAQGSGVTIPSLQEEWKKFIEVVLASMVNRSRIAFHLQHLYTTGGVSKIFAGAEAWRIHWARNIAVNLAQMRIDGTCPHLDAITA